MRAATADRVTYRWDAPYGVVTDWYCEAWTGDQVVDSQKLWFPVDVSSYDQDQEEDLVAALRGAFPEAAIETA